MTSTTRLILSRLMNQEKTHIHALILDMDGVLWRDQQPIGDLPEIFRRIDERGFKVVLATNNATLSIQQYLDKLEGFGVHLESWQIVNTAEATAAYLEARFPQGGSIFIIGENGLEATLNKRGFFHSDEEEVIAVVAGLDRQLSFEKLVKATQHIRSGVPFIGTNPDRSFPTPKGLIPGAGAILAALEAATDIQATIIGKPQPEMYLLALQRLKSLPEETLVVGDRLETDIAGAQTIGCKTGLVLSGVSDKPTALAWLPKLDYIEPDLTSLIEKL